MNLETCIARVMGRRWLTILLSLLVMLAFAAGAGNIVSVDVDVRNHFSKDDPHIVALERLEDTYALSDAALVAVAPRKGTIFTRETLVAIEELTEQLWRTPYVTRVDSITNYSHSEGLEDELVVEPLIDDAGSLSDKDIERIKTIALGTEEIAGRFVSRDGRVAGISRIELKENWLQLLDESYEFRRSTDFISENFTGVETYEYSLDSGREGGISDISAGSMRSRSGIGRSRKLPTSLPSPTS